MAKELVVALSLGGTLTHTGQAKRSSSVGRPLDGPSALRLVPNCNATRGRSIRCSFPVVPISESGLKCALNLEDAGLDIGVFLLQIGQDRLKFGVRLKNV